MEVPESYPRGVPISIKYPEIPVHSFLENTARKFPDRDASIYLDSKIRYNKLWDQATRFARALRDLNVRKGDRVALLLPNTPHFIIAYNGVTCIGGIVVTLNPLMPRQEIHRELELTDAKALIVLDKLLDKLPEDIPQTLIVAEAASYAPFHLRLLNRLVGTDKRTSKGTYRFKNLVSGSTLKEKSMINPREDVAAILFTAGTTGTPKGVMLTHYNLVSNALQSYHWLRGWGYSAKPQPRGWPVVLCALPFFHSYGMVVMNEAIQFGCTLVLLPKPNPEKIMKATDKYSVTHFPLIPRFIREILNHPDLEMYDLTSITSCATGGANIPMDLMKSFEGVVEAKFYQGYGLTEAGPSTHATPVEGEPRYKSVGMAYPDTDCKIVELKTGEIEMPPGRLGEVVIKGPQIMKGYWKDPDTTREVLRDGWLYTGDIGRIDEEGYLYIIGRKRERIIANGHTIWPREVEEALIASPYVESAVAIGVPDPLRCTTDIRSLVVPRKDNNLEELEKDLYNYCKKHLEPYEIPSKIEFVESLPKTVMGKMDREKIECMINKKMKDYIEEQAER